MRYSSTRFVVRYSMRLMLAIVILFTLSILFCCMDDNDRHGFNLNENLHKSHRGIKVHKVYQNSSRVNKEWNQAKLQDHVFLSDGQGKRRKYNVVPQKVSSQYLHMMYNWQKCQRISFKNWIPFV